MKRLNNFLLTAATFAGLTFGSLDSKAQYDRIRLDYQVDHNNFAKKIEATAFVKDRSPPWSSIIYEDTDKNYSFDEIRLWTHTDSSKAKYQWITLDGEQKKLDYSSALVDHSLKNGDWGEKENQIRIKGNFPEELQERINKIVNMNKSCGEEWRDFLNKEINRFGERWESKDIDQYIIMYYRINKENFPQLIFIKALDYDFSRTTPVSSLMWNDTNKDNLYDYFRVGVKKNTENKNMYPNAETIKIDHEKGTISYLLYSNYNEVMNIKDRNLKDFSPEQQKRIKKIVNLDVGCGDNELIPFLYEQYDKWYGSELYVSPKEVNEKEFLIHTVGREESLFSLSKRYGVEIKDILTNNPETRGGLTIGQELKILNKKSE